MKKIYNSDTAPAPIGPYSQAVSAGGFLYISGQIPIDQPNNKLIDGSIEKETEQVMKNLEMILNSAELNFSHVVKTSIFVKNMSDFSRINEVYGKSFPNDPPARETVEVSALPKGVNVEISCIAYFPG